MTEIFWVIYVSVCIIVVHVYYNLVHDRGREVIIEIWVYFVQGFFRCSRLICIINILILFYLLFFMEMFISYIYKGSGFIGIVSCVYRVVWIIELD